MSSSAAQGGATMGAEGQPVLPDALPVCPRCHGSKRDTFTIPDDGGFIGRIKVSMPCIECTDDGRAAVASPRKRTERAS